MASSAVESPSEYLRTVERAFETANAVPLVKSAMIENEAQGGNSIEQFFWLEKRETRFRFCDMSELPIFNLKRFLWLGTVRSCCVFAL